MHPLHVWAGDMQHQGHFILFHRQQGFASPHSFVLDFLSSSSALRPTDGAWLPGCPAPGSAHRPPSPRTFSSRCFPTRSLRSSQSFCCGRPGLLQALGGEIKRDPRKQTQTKVSLACAQGSPHHRGKGNGMTPEQRLRRSFQRLEQETCRGQGFCFM